MEFFNHRSKVKKQKTSCSSVDCFAFTMLNSSRQKEVVKIESSQCLLLEVEEFYKARQILGNGQHLDPDEQFLLEHQQVEPQAEALQEEAEGEQGG